MDSAGHAQEVKQAKTNNEATETKGNMDEDDEKFSVCVGEFTQEEKEYIIRKGLVRVKEDGDISYCSTLVESDLENDLTFNSFSKASSCIDDLEDKEHDLSMDEDKENMPLSETKRTVEQEIKKSILGEKDLSMSFLTLISKGESEVIECTSEVTQDVSRTLSMMDMETSNSTEVDKSFRGSFSADSVGLEILFQSTPVSKPPQPRRSSRILSQASQRAQFNRIVEQNTENSILEDNLTVSVLHAIAQGATKEREGVSEATQDASLTCPMMETSNLPEVDKRGSFLMESAGLERLFQSTPISKPPQLRRSCRILARTSQLPQFNRTVDQDTENSILEDNLTVSVLIMGSQNETKETERASDDAKHALPNELETLKSTIEDTEIVHQDAENSILEGENLTVSVLHSVAQGETKNCEDASEATQDASLILSMIETSNSTEVDKRASYSGECVGLARLFQSTPISKPPQPRRSNRILARTPRLPQFNRIVDHDAENSILEEENLTVSVLHMVSSQSKTKKCESASDASKEASPKQLEMSKSVITGAGIFDQDAENSILEDNLTVSVLHAIAQGETNSEGVFDVAKDASLNEFELSKSTIAESKISEQEAENSILEQDVEKSALELETGNSVLEQEVEKSALELETGNSVLEQEAEKSVLEPETENSILEQDVEKSALELETGNSVLEQEVEKSVLELETENSVLEQEAEKSVLEPETENSILEQDVEKSALELETENSVLEQEVEKSVLELETENSVLEQEAEKSVFEQEAEKSVFEQEAEKSVLEQEAEKSVLQQEAEKSVLEQEAEKSVLEQAAEKSFLEQEAEKSVLDLEAEKSVLEQEAEKSVLQQEAEKSVLELEAEKKVLEQEAEKSMLELEAEKSVLEQEAEKSMLEKETEKSVLEQVAEKSVLEQEAEKSELEQEAEISVVEQEAEKSVLEQEPEKSLLEKEAENSVLENNLTLSALNAISQAKPKGTESAFDVTEDVSLNELELSKSAIAESETVDQDAENSILKEDNLTVSFQESESAFDVAADASLNKLEMSKSKLVDTGVMEQDAENSNLVEDNFTVSLSHMVSKVTADKNENELEISKCITTGAGISEEEAENSVFEEENLSVSLLHKISGIQTSRIANVSGIIQDISPNLLEISTSQTTDKRIMEQQTGNSEVVDNDLNTSLLNLISQSETNGIENISDVTQDVSLSVFDISTSKTSDKRASFSAKGVGLESLFQSTPVTKTPQVRRSSRIIARTSLLPQLNCARNSSIGLSSPQIKKRACPNNSIKNIVTNSPCLINLDSSSASISPCLINLDNSIQNDCKTVESQQMPLSTEKAEITSNSLDSNNLNLLRSHKESNTSSPSMLAVVDEISIEPGKIEFPGNAEISNDINMHIDDYPEQLISVTDTDVNESRGTQDGSLNILEASKNSTIENNDSKEDLEDTIELMDKLLARAEEQEAEEALVLQQIKENAGQNSPKLNKSAIVARKSVKKSPAPNTVKKQEAELQKCNSLAVRPQYTPSPRPLPFKRVMELKKKGHIFSPSPPRPAAQSKLVKQVIKTIKPRESPTTGTFKAPTPRSSKVIGSNNILSPSPKLRTSFGRNFVGVQAKVDTGLRGVASPGASLGLASPVANHIHSKAVPTLFRRTPCVSNPPEETKSMSTGKVWPVPTISATKNNHGSFIPRPSLPHLGAGPNSVEKSRLSSSSLLNSSRFNSKHGTPSSDSGKMDKFKQKNYTATPKIQPLNNSSFAEKHQNENYLSQRHIGVRDENCDASIVYNSSIPKKFIPSRQPHN